MPQRSIRFALALTIALPLLSWSCASSARQRPVEGGPVSTSAGSLAATRKAFEGTWTLESLEVVEAGGARRAVKAGGQLTYDAFGNMTIRGVIDDPALRDKVVLDYTGRITIDPVKHEFYPADLQSDRPADAAAIVAVSPDKVRRYELAGGSFVVTYLDTASNPTAVARWKR